MLSPRRNRRAQRGAQLRGLGWFPDLGSAGFSGGLCISAFIPGAPGPVLSVPRHKNRSFSLLKMFARSYLCSSLKDILGARVWQLRNMLQEGDPLPAEWQGLRPSPGRRVGCDSFLRHRTVAGWPQAQRWVGIHQAALPTSGGEATSRCSDQQLWPSPAVLTHSAMAQPRVTSSTAGQRRSQPAAGLKSCPPGSVSIITKAGLFHLNAKVEAVQTAGDRQSCT